MPMMQGGNRRGSAPRGSGARGAVNARRNQLSPEPYSLGHLKVLFQRLIDAQEGRGEGETTVVETLRGKFWLKGEGKWRKMKEISS